MLGLPETPGLCGRGREGLLAEKASPAAEAREEAGPEGGDQPGWPATAGPPSDCDQYWGGGTKQPLRDTGGGNY